MGGTSSVAERQRRKESPLLSYLSCRSAPGEVDDEFQSLLRGSDVLLAVSRRPRSRSTECASGSRRIDGHAQAARHAPSLCSLFSLFFSTAALALSHSLTSSLLFSSLVLSQTPLPQQGLGYTDEDSAGQSNIFAVEVRKSFVLSKNSSEKRQHLFFLRPLFAHLDGKQEPDVEKKTSSLQPPTQPKQYVAGSSRDNAANSQSTAVYAVSAGLVGLAAIVAAFSLGGANERGAGVDVAATAGAAVPKGALSISKYASKFTTTVAAPAAPALVE